MKISELLRDPEKVAEEMRRALALGRTWSRHLRLIGRKRNGPNVRYYKPDPYAREALQRQKLARRLADGQGEARHITPPPVAMVEAQKRREER